MAGRRTERVGNLIQKELARIFQKEARSWIGSALVTVSGVEVTNDLSIARIHLSIFGAPDKEKALQEIEFRSGEIRGQLGQALRHDLRQIPELQFFLDDSLDKADHMDKIFDKLDIPPPEEEEDEN